MNNDIQFIEEESWGDSKLNIPTSFNHKDLLIMVYEGDEKNILFEYNGQKYEKAKKNPLNVIELKEPLTIKSLRDTISQQDNGLRQWPAIDVINRLEAKYDFTRLATTNDGLDNFDVLYHVGDRNDMIILTTITDEAEDWWYRGTMKNDSIFQTKPWTPGSITDKDDTIDSDDIKLWISIDNGGDVLISFSSDYFQISEETNKLVECRKEKKERRRSRGRPQKKKILPAKKKLPEKAGKPQLPSNKIKYVTDQLGKRFNNKMAWDPRDVIQVLRQIGDEYGILACPKFEPNITTSNQWAHLNNSGEQVLAMFR